MIGIVYRDDLKVNLELGGRGTPGAIGKVLESGRFLECPPCFGRPAGSDYA
jgi:hypothetical protein